MRELINRPMKEKKLRFWLFAWYIGDARGGLEDLCGTYATLEEAYAAAKSEQAVGSDCWDILDIESMIVVAGIFHGVGPDGEDQGDGTPKADRSPK